MPIPQPSSGRATPVGGSSHAKRDSTQSLSGAPSTSAGGSATSVQVALRIRPTTAQDAVNIPQRFQRAVISATSNTSLSVESAPSAAVNAATGANAPASAAASANAAKKQAFNFDRVVSPKDGQPAVYSVAAPLIDKFLEGYNVTILAYGQTSSGKSYTMGTDYHGGSLTNAESEDVERWGIIPRAVASIFDRIRQLQASGNSYSLKNSYIEIYNEDLIDLLDPQGRQSQQHVTIREDKGRIIWSGLREMKVANADDVMNNLSQGSSLRQTNSTDMNAQSSRSHAIFSLTLTSRKWAGSGPPPSGSAPPVSPGTSRIAQHRGSMLQHPGSRVNSPTPGGRPGSITPSGIPDRPGSRFGLRAASGGGGRVSPMPPGDDDEGGSGGQWVTTTSKFHFVDLAGSERLKRTAAAGERVKEGISINSGLHALGNVISALGDPAKARATTHIPYRDSKLTRLLQDSLGGNAHTLMVACASPAEYNLAETLNTLKYANRARNIKNRAELNEVEVGWDDVEYLQKLVTKLREELSHLKAGGGGGGSGSNMRTINEEGGGGGGRNQAGMLELQQQYSELSQKYAKLTAELTKAQSSAATAAKSSALSPEEFEHVVAPVVQEYEKSLSALESQLALTKAALLHAEESMREQEERLSFEQQVNESNAQLIDDLKSRVAKLAEREALSDTYIRDLEAKLKAEDESKDSNLDLVAELRREIARYRETGGNNERYIKDLEARLSKCDEGTAQLRQQVEALEHQVQRREDAYRELNDRMALMDTSDQQKMLLEELDEKEKKLAELEKSLEELREEKDAFDGERTRLNSAAERTESEKAELILELQQLRNGGINPTAVGDDKVNAPDLASSADPQALQINGLRSRLDHLQTKHAATLEELQTVSTRYRDSLKEIEDLAQQVEEARLVHSESTDNVPSPLPSPKLRLHHSTSYPSLSTKASEENREVPPVPPLPQPPPVSPSKSPRSRRSMPLTGRGVSFLGRQNSLNGSNSHLRSVSLSQELSSAQGSLSSYPPSPRTVSPNGVGSQERSYESLEKEIMQLQETLRARDDEIVALERSMRVLEGAPSRNETEKTPPKMTVTAGEETPRRSPSPEGADEDLNMSPQTRSAFQALKEELAELNGPSQVSEEEQEVRLDKLMRSMARKESTHRQVMEDLQDRLTGLTRQHDELKALSHNQVINMSEEITSLRSQIRDGEAAEVLTQKLAAMQSDLDSSAKEVDDARQQAEVQIKEMTQKLTAEHQKDLANLKENHAETLKSLQEAHAEELRSALQEKDQILADKIAEYERALKTHSAEHEDALRKKDSDHERTLAGKDEEFRAALRRKEEDYAEAIKRFEIERSAAAGDKTAVDEAFAKAQEEHASSLARREADFESTLSKVKEEHAGVLSQRDEDHESKTKRLRQEHDDTLAGMIEDNSSALSRLRDERDNDLKRLKESHQTTMDELKTNHEKFISALKADHAAELETQQQKLQSEYQEKESQQNAAHESTLNDLRSSHLTELEKLSANHESALSDLKSSHQVHTQELDAQHQERIQALESAHAEALSNATKEHQDRLADLASTRGDESDSAIQALKAEQEAALSSLKQSHEVATAKVAEDHAAAITQLKVEHGQTLATQQDAQEALLAEARADHESKFSSELTDLTSVKTNLSTEIAELNGKLRDSEHERSQLSSKVNQVLERLQQEGEEHEVVRADLQKTLDTREKELELAKKHRAEGGDRDLQEALDALSTLEKALVESQEERDKYAEELEAIRSERSSTVPSSKYDSLFKDLERQRTSLGQINQELETVRKERDSLSVEKIKQDQQLRDLQPRHSQQLNGSVDGHTRSDSTSTADGATDGVRSPTAQKAALLGLGVGSMTNGKPPPPPTPPPSMPPPPLPTSLPQPSSTNSVSSASKSSGPRTSTGSTVTRNSESSPPTSVRSPTNSMTDSIAIDARVARRLDEQEQQLQKLTKQLQHCESDLQANVDLVNTLESALNDAERNLRKARTQMNDMTKEKDEVSRQNDMLRQEVLAARTEVESVRSSVLQVEGRLEQERLAKENARQQLDRRMEEMSRRKSKFACF